jgi:hypothetical protein
VGGRIIERQQQRAGRGVLDAALDAQGPLSHGRQKVWRRKPLGDVPVQAQPVQAGPGQDHGIELSLKGPV